MKKTITIELTLNTESGLIEELAMIEGVYQRTEFISDWDKPETINEAMSCIADELADMI